MGAAVAGAGGAPRLAEVLAAVSLVTDLGMGEEQGEAVRACLVAVGLGRRLGLTGERLTEVYYTALLHHIGCTATAAEEAARFRMDETVLRPLVTVTDFTGPAEMLPFLRAATAKVPPGRRLGLAGRLAASNRWGAGAQHATCEVAAAMAGRLGLGPGVQEALHQQFERWDGKGGPDGVRDEEFTLPARIAVLAAQAVRLAATGGPAAAVAALRKRGSWLGPGLVAEFGTDGTELLAETADPYEDALAAEPVPWRRLADPDVDRLATALGDLADLKSTCLHGHSRGVAELAQHAAEPGDRTLARRAALVHDLGRIAVPSRIWDMSGPLTALDREAVDLHAYHGERVLGRCAALRELATVVGQHHERLDGSGYHRQATGAAVLPASRLLAAADVYHAMTEPRPYREELSAASAAVELEREAREGRLDPQAVHAVLDAAGAARHRSAPWPAGLSDREVDVLRLLARGSTNRAIAERLTISPRTAEHHVEHIYAKTGCATRPAAALYAMEHGLLTGH
ncbi:HD domain-containing protein [Streptomyces sp. TLI_235]|nr:HD domain-containing phosphohydrolase [Streptomyces sp. TLI_235]PBC78503.1 HD domain-containing protein [Streptomyces sp. TLI_235]